MSSANPVSHQIVRFFTENPDEELSMQDMQAKWGRSRSAVMVAVLKLRREGRLQLRACRRGRPATCVETVWRLER